MKKKEKGNRTTAIALVKSQHPDDKSQHSHHCIVHMNMHNCTITMNRYVIETAKVRYKTSPLLRDNRIAEEYYTNLAVLLKLNTFWTVQKLLTLVGFYALSPRPLVIKH